MSKIYLNEKSRIDNLLKQGKITNVEHQTLLSALASVPQGDQHFWEYLINPFQSLSAPINLAVGLGSILLLCFIGQKLGLHFRGVLDFKILARAQPAYSVAQLFSQNIVDVLSISILFYVGALINQRKNLRIIDFIGTISLCRLPYALFALALYVLIPVFPGLVPNTNEPAETPLMLILILFAIIFLVWQITLMFTALKEASGLKGKSLRVTFTLGIVLAEILSYSINTLLLK